MPNLLLVVVVVYGLLWNATPTLLAAIIGGFVLDLASGYDFGLRMAFYAAVALGVVAVKQLGMRADSVVTGLLLVAAGTILYNLVVLAALGSWPNGVAIGRIVRELIDNLAVVTLIFIARANVGGRTRQTVELSGRFTP